VTDALSLRQPRAQPSASPTSACPNSRISALSPPAALRSCFRQSTCALWRRLPGRSTKPLPCPPAPARAPAAVPLVPFNITASGWRGYWPQGRLKNGTGSERTSRFRGKRACCEVPVPIFQPSRPPCLDAPPRQPASSHRRPRLAGQIDPVWRLGAILGGSQNRPAADLNRPASCSPRWIARCTIAIVLAVPLSPADDCTCPALHTAHAERNHATPNR
jgi:hypothetical protein